MLYTGRIYQCDRCGEQSIQPAQHVEPAGFGAQLVAMGEGLHGWTMERDWLLCPDCARKWEHTTRNFFRPTQEGNNG